MFLSVFVPMKDKTERGLLEGKEGFRMKMWNHWKPISLTDSLHIGLSIDPYTCPETPSQLWIPPGPIPWLPLRQVSSPSATLRRGDLPGKSPYPLGRNHQHCQVSPQGSCVPPMAKEQERAASLGQGKQCPSSSLPEVSGSNGWYCPSPFALDWVDSLIDLPVPCLSILGSGEFYSQQLTRHAPQWRNLYILSISIALGNVFTGIWLLKARCNRPMIKKLMIKAP